MAATPPDDQPVGQPRPRDRSPAPKVSRQLADAVRFFTDPDSDPKMRNNIPLSLSLQAVISESDKTGLGAPHIRRLVNVAASGKFADTTSSRLIKSLLPYSVVPEDAVVDSISWMCTNKPSQDIQALMLKWIVLTFDLLSSTENLHCLYGIIFYFLDNDTMCPYACHLLYLLTRREDVTPHRVRRLLSIQKRVGIQPHLTGLLSIYKVFAPHLVSMSLPATQRAYFRHTDRTWLARINEARDRSEARRRGDVSTSLVREVTHRTITDSAMVRKRRKLNPVPDICSASLILDPRADDMTKVPLEQIKSFEEFLKNFDRLELPSQAAAVLRSPVLQHLIVCRRDQHTIHRLNFWLSQKLQSELLDSEGENPRTEQLLQLLINFSDFIQESLPVFEQFLTRYLLTWNGLDYRPYILRLVTRFRIYPFTVLQDLVLEPLRVLFFCSSVYFKCQLVYTLTELLRNYATHEISRYQEAARRQKMSHGDQEGVTDGDSTTSGGRVFTSRVDYFDPLETLKELVGFVDGLCSVALQTEQSNSLLIHHTLAFYELVSVLYTKHGLVFLHLPSEVICYRAAFGSDPTATTRLCQIICNYKAEFTALKNSHAEHQQWSSFKTGILALNGIILTLCNCLWRNKALEAGLQHGVTMETMKPTGILHPNEMFSMQGSLAMVCYCRKFFEETQPAEKRVEPRMIKSSHKPIYLEFLRRERVDGMVNFMETFIRRSASDSTTLNRSGLTTSQVA